MKPTLEYLQSRISVDVNIGKVYWVDATKHHRNLVGSEAGTSRRHTSNGKSYWHVKIDSIPLKRSHLVFLFSKGCWPELQIDHINGDSLDDRIENLREVTAIQNSWNHKRRRKEANTPMGVRMLPSGAYQARITCNKQQIVIGSYETAQEASAIYQSKRKEMFGEYA